MKKTFLLLLISMLFLSIFAACSIKPPSSSEETINLEALYVKQNEFLTCTGHDTYISFYKSNQNYVFERLFYYRWKTGSTLSFEDVQAYLASEYEEDGSVRIYNNGNWPDIEAYVDWGWAHKKEMDEFHDDVIYEMVEWTETYPALFMEYKDFSLHNLNEILLTMQDENYEPNFIFE